MDDYARELGVVPQFGQEVQKAERANGGWHVRTQNQTFEADGRREAFDAIVLATGYQATLDEFLDDAKSHLNERGYPKLLADEADHPGPYFIGFGNPPTGLLSEISHQAKAVAAKIAEANQQ